MPDQNIGNIGLEEALNFLLPKDLGEYKKFRSVMGVMVPHSSWSCFCVLKGENR
jgi:hypothetical protein